MNSNKINKQKGVWLIMMKASILMLTISSCEKFVQVPPPPGQITGDYVYTTNATAISVLTDIYSNFNTDGLNQMQGSSSISLFAGLASDEYELYNGASNGSYMGYYNNALTQSTGGSFTGAEHWTLLYNFIFKCNAAIEGLTASKSLTPAIKQQLLGEAKFMRAFIYFYLVNMFGDVPLALSTDPEINTSLARSPKDQVYEQIKNDLNEAKGLLSDNFLNSTLLNATSERVRPTKWAAAALLARVYLYKGEWVNAEAQSSLVINNGGLFGLPTDLNAVFLKNSREAIWQIQPTTNNFNTLEAQTLIIPPTGPNSNQNPVFLRKELQNSFETGDQRAVLGNWIDNTIYMVSNSPVIWDTVAYPYKYKINFSPNVNSIDGLTEYFMVLRLAEQYLIRAEARAQQGNIGGAQSDLNAIRNRAGLPNTTSNDQSSLLTAILNERRHELFSEWGHRWFDLKRTGKVDAVMTVVTPQKSNGTTQWQSYQQWYPLPYAELQKAPNLRQNSGY